MTERIEGKPAEHFIKKIKAATTDREVLSILKELCHLSYSNGGELTVLFHTVYQACWERYVLAAQRIEGTFGLDFNETV